MPKLDQLVFKSALKLDKTFFFYVCQSHVRGASGNAHKISNFWDPCQTYL